MPLSQVHSGQRFWYRHHHHCIDGASVCGAHLLRVRVGLGNSLLRYALFRCVLVLCFGRCANRVVHTVSSCCVVGPACRCVCRWLIRLRACHNGNPTAKKNEPRRFDAQTKTMQQQNQQHTFNNTKRQQTGTNDRA